MLSIHLVLTEGAAEGLQSNTFGVQLAEAVLPEGKRSSTRRGTSVGKRRTRMTEGPTMNGTPPDTSQEPSKADRRRPWRGEITPSSSIALVSKPRVYNKRF